MHQQERIRLIAEILEQNGFVTVKHLTEQLHYSTATINRDLNKMQSQGILRRSFGGAELVAEKRVPLHFRYSQMRPVKNKIGKKAAGLIQNGDTVFIDCSTTAQCIGKYITDRKDLKVGDLVFFNTVDDGASDLCDHVGIYIGDNEFIHASSAAGKVTISSLGTSSSSYYYRTFSWGRRIIN